MKVLLPFFRLDVKEKLAIDVVNYLQSGQFGSCSFFILTDKDYIADVSKV